MGFVFWDIEIFGFYLGHISTWDLCSGFCICRHFFAVYMLVALNGSGILFSYCCSLCCRICTDVISDDEDDDMIKWWLQFLDHYCSYMCISVCNECGNWNRFWMFLRYGSGKVKKGERGAVSILPSLSVAEKQVGVEPTLRVLFLLCFPSLYN